MKKNSPLQTGEAVLIEPGVELDAKRGPIVIGDRSRISSGVKILPDGGRVELGADCLIGPYCILYGHGGLLIGSGTRIGAHTVIIPANHLFSDPDKPICQQGLSKEGIRIGNHVQIGCHVSILDGVTIGDGALIEHGSVVSRPVAAGSHVGGAPAKSIEPNPSPENSV
jgi:acetyltransferase-like isoleucine patch superfamily enzyme